LCFGLKLIMFFHLDPIVLGVSDTFQHILTTNHVFADIPRLFLHQFEGQHNVKFANKTFILTPFQSLTHWWCIHIFIWFWFLRDITRSLLDINDNIPSVLQLISLLLLHIGW